MRRMKPQPQMGVPTILFIAGAQRSGSTIMDNILGQIDGFTSVGELRALWQNGLLEGRYCGCGAHVRECPFWGEVQARAFGDCPPDPATVVAIQDAYLRTRPRQLIGLKRAARGGVPASLDRYMSIIGSVYRAIAEVGRTKVIVDSSKVPADVYALATLSGLDVRVLHLVRDPRAVAYSWSRAKPSPDDPNHETMHTRGPLSSSASWLVWNETMDRLVRPVAVGRFMRLRYEDFTAQPRAAVGEVCRFVGATETDLPFTDERHVHLGPTHGPSGNPDRLRKDGSRETSISAHEAWQGGMKGLSRLLATVPAAPLLRRYNYRLCSRRS